MTSTVRPIGEVQGWARDRPYPPLTHPADATVPVP